MRSEDLVIKQILDFADKDSNIRAVVMNGSRVNPNIKKDIFCDYDIIYFVHNLEKYTFNQNWIPYFGNLVIMQFNRHDDYPEDHYVYLMQFDDGVRIDLSFSSMKMIKQFVEDSLTIVLLDKDQCVPSVPPPNESSYITKSPKKEEFDLITNEFWWVSTYVAKALWRNEIVSAKNLFEVIVRDCLNKMINWYLAMQYDWKINVGKMGKNFEKFLSPDLWQELLATYPGAVEEEIWLALFTAGDLMRKVSIPVADKLGYPYPNQDDEKVSRYLRQVKALPKDAASFD